MSFQSDLITALDGHTELTDIVGTRIFSEVADGAAAAPYLVYQVISTDGETPHSGTRDLSFPLIQFSIWSNSRTECITIAAVLDALLDGQTLAGDSGIVLTFSDEQSRHEPSTNLFGTIMDFRGACNRN